MKENYTTKEEDVASSLISNTTLTRLETQVSRLAEVFEKHYSEDADWKKMDAEWKRLADPVIRMGQDFSIFGRTAKGILYVIITMGAAMAVIWGAIEWLKK